MTQTKLNVEWALGHFDPWNTDLSYENIWSLYRAMRESSAAVYSDAHGGFWSLSRYNDVKIAARDYRVFSSAQGTAIGKRDSDPTAPPNAPIEFDPPNHTRFRRAMQIPFLPSKMAEFRDGIRTSVNDSLDQIALKGTFDVVSDLAESVPQNVLSKLLGFDEETRQRNRSLVLGVVHATFESRADAWRDYRSFLREQVTKRKMHPTDDFLSHLCNDEFEGKTFSDRELVGMLVALALAGHHTSINAISSLVRRASDERVKTAYFMEPQLINQIVEETLRCDPPVHIESRTTTEQVEIGGVTIPPKSSVALLYGSANRDRSFFENADHFDYARKSNQHLSFGYGIHLCLGMHLARLEMSVVLEELLRRFPHYSLSCQPIDSGMVYGHHMGWKSMPAVIE